jgi:formylglycine-generating enzyme required for sulfatase activity/tRNA A-37 threonylcarbamoyl transferase component Bud32
MKVILGGSASRGGDETANVDAKLLARFLEEAQVTSQLDHPGIVPVHELGLDADGRVYFTMKLVKGRDLRTIFELVEDGKEGWNDTRALSVMLKVCEAVAYAHKKGVIHRDLKPANIMVGGFGEVFVMDWGLARVIGRKDAHDVRPAPDLESALRSVHTARRDEREELAHSPVVTMDGDVMGTPAYMAPEQARGAVEEIGPRSDVYSVGAMLYHLLARTPPYMSPAMLARGRSVLEMVLEGPPEPLATLRRDLPNELVAICDKAMSREAAARYADTLELAEDLRAYLENRVVRAYETGAWAEARKWVRRNKALASATLGAVALLVAGLATSMFFKARADDKAREAELNLAQARTNEERALREEKLATQKANDVLSLSAIQELKELTRRADSLWPVHPDTLPAFDAWIADAKTLVEGRAADPARGVESRPGLRDHEARLADIRKRAKALTSEEIERDRRTTQAFAEWQAALSRLTWMRRMSGDVPWPSEAEVEAELAKETLPPDAGALASLARPLVESDPAKAVYGSEVRAVLIARRALAATDDADRPAIRRTLARALFRAGRLDEALAEGQRSVDEANAKQKEDFASSQKDLQDDVAAWKGDGSSDDARAKRAEEISDLADRVAALERTVNEHRAYAFDDPQDRWWHEQLAELVADLKAFTDPKTGLYSDGESEEHGWSVPRRRAMAIAMRERTVAGADAKRRWDEAIGAIAKSHKYGGLKLTPQMGLLPIGEDPASHLWEFAHVLTGEPAQRGSDGRLVLKESTGLVFVLIPRGKFWMGAQHLQRRGHNFDPMAKPDEAPVREVQLDAFFLSKFEMTQGQWEFFAVRNPSVHGRRGYPRIWNRANRAWSALHPTEQVSWSDCKSLLDRLGLVLPTEAQWEYACRAGTSTAYSSGDAKEALASVANLADRFAKEHGGARWASVYEEWDDGNASHAEIGSYASNAFGLHDMLGNVSEWCRDAFGSYDLPTREGDGERQVVGATMHVRRGGSFVNTAPSARSADRAGGSADLRTNSIGVRPSRAIAP